MKWSQRRTAAVGGPAIALAAALVCALSPAASAHHGPPGPTHGHGAPAVAWVTPGTHHEAAPHQATQGSDAGDAQSGTDQPDPGASDGQGEATNGGSALPGDSGLGPDQLTPTAPPLTAYQLPFPCGEIWTGSTRAGHSPSVRAVDFNYPGGDLGRSVVAAAAGTVVTAVTGMDRGSYGQYVVVDHGNGESSLYGHLNTVLVSLGQVVAAGTPIGTVGETGNATGPHLHFEERLGGAVVDPWFAGARFPMNSALASENCGAVLHPAVPLAGDLYGGSRAELVVYRPGSHGSFVIQGRHGRPRVDSFGSAAALPVLGDWDGDGHVDPGLWLSGRRVFRLQVGGATSRVRFGKAGDVPIAGNWDGAGPAEVGVRRGDRFLLRAHDGSVTRVAWGDPGEAPVTGDWNGDGITDLGVYDTATGTFLLRGIDPFGDPYPLELSFGRPGDQPVTGDWNGDGITDLGVWRPSGATFLLRVLGAHERTVRTRLEQ